LCKYPFVVKPTFLQRLKLRTFYGRVFYGWDYEGFEEPMKLFLWRCSDCDLFQVDYVHGYGDRGWVCGVCDNRKSVVSKLNMSVSPNL
jgi:hypothetical protein